VVTYTELSLLTFKESSGPSKEVKSQSLSLVHSEQVCGVKAALVAFVILGKDVFELLGSKASLVVVSHGIATVLVLVDIGNVDSEERVGNPGWCGWVTQVEVDGKGREEAQRDGPSPGSETAIRVLWPDDAVAILVPVDAVLLHDLGSVSVSMMSLFKSDDTVSCSCPLAQLSRVVPSGASFEAATLTLAVPASTKRSPSLG